MLEKIRNDMKAQVKKMLAETKKGKNMKTATQPPHPEESTATLTKKIQQFDKLRDKYPPHPADSTDPRHLHPKPNTR